MRKFILRRILYMIPVLGGVILLTFILFNIAGGDAAGLVAGQHASAERIAEVREQLGLNDPLFVQLVNYFKQMLTLDFGRSWSTKQSIGSMIWAGVGPSLSFTLPGFILAQIISISLSLLVVRWRGSYLDKGTMTICLALLSISPLAYILYFQYGLAYTLGLFPIAGWDDSLFGRWEYLILPILIYVIVSLGSNVLFFRAVFIDEFYQDYVRTARSKGLGENKVLFKHVLRNAMIPVITILVYQMPFLIVGSLLLESFFGIPGLGGTLYLAIQNADFPVIKAMTFVGAVLYMIFQLLSDVLFAVADPKVQLR